MKTSAFRKRLAKKSGLLVALWFVAFAGSVLAKDPELATAFNSVLTIQLPTEPVADPLLRPAPEYSRWVTHYCYQSDGEKAASTPGDATLPRRVRKSVTTKTANLIREDLQEESGRLQQRWYDGKTQYFKAPGDPCWFQSRGEIKDDPNYFPIPQNGFRDSEWIDRKSFAGFGSWQGRLCLVFIPGGISITVQNSGKNIVQIKADTYAYVDAQTRLPLVIKKGEELHRIEFLAPLQEMQKLPVDLQEQISKAAAAVRQKR